jgi:Family of unknown function (DUF6252)
MRPLCVFAALTALTVACGGGNTPTSPSLPSLPSLPSGPTGITLLTRGTVRATVDGVQWESSAPFASVGPSFTGLSPVLTVSASAPGSALTVLFTVPAVAGNYESGSSNFANFTLTEGQGRIWSVSPFIASTRGTLTITTAAATRVAGTFSFTAAAAAPGLTPATRTVTNGTFDVSQ